MPTKTHVPQYQYEGLDCSLVGMLLYVTSDTVIFGRKTSLLNNIVCIYGVAKRILFLLLRSPVDGSCMLFRLRPSDVKRGIGPKRKAENSLD